MSNEMQKAQDMLSAALQQRDNALNAVIVAQAENAGIKRELAIAQEEIAKQKAIAELAKQPVDQPVSNGELAAPAAH